MKPPIVPLLFTVFALAACSAIGTGGAAAGAHLASGPCADRAGFRTDCGFRNPEDIVVAPDGEQLIISEMGEFLQDTPGRLQLFDLATRRRSPMPLAFDTPGESRLDRTCTRPDAALFSPHGIDLTVARDGSFLLWVVNHGGRDSVEVFELTKADGAWGARWQGCATPPGDPFLNDVSGLADGGFLVTHMWDKHTAYDVLVKKLSVDRENTGWVWRWKPGAGFARVPASDGMMPNGIAVSRDSRYAFVNMYMGNRTIKLDLDAGRQIGEFEVRQPDNVTLDGEGNLWIASQLHDPINDNCRGVETGACLLPFQIVKAGSESLQPAIVLTHEGEPIGYATVALRVGDRIFVGSAHGDRIASAEVAVRP